MTKFVIGIGSQRAGSTLLHRILDNCSPVYMHPVKELHYFDTLYKVRNENVLRHYSTNQLNHHMDQILKAKNFAFINKRYKNSLRANFLLATKKVQNISYIELFRPCVQQNEMLGEITPEYMILPQEGIQKMREVVGDDAKIILIARNPVKRFVSAFKLLMYGHRNNDKSVFEQEMLNLLEKTDSQWLAVQDALNDYESALANYQKEFDHVLMLSYDKLFGEVEGTAEQLSDFLNVNISLPTYKNLVGTKINALNETADLTESTLSVLETRYTASQAYLDRVFGINHCSS